MCLRGHRLQECTFSLAGGELNVLQKPPAVASADHALGFFEDGLPFLLIFFLLLFVNNLLLKTFKAG